MYPAHIRKENTQDGGTKYVIQSVAEHCRNTATHAGDTLKSIGLEKTTYLAGLLHDCGKNSEKFKAYIEDAVIHEKEVKCGSVKHSFVGMRYILSKRIDGDDYKNLAIELIAYAVGAHHGLFDCVTDNKESAFVVKANQEDSLYEDAIKNYFEECTDKKEIEQLLTEAVDEVNKIIEKIISINSTDSDKNEVPFYYALLCRLITSAVIYGDRKDTCEFYKNNITINKRTHWNNVLEKFNSYLSCFKEVYKVDYARKEISQACADAAQKEEGCSGQAFL